VVSTGSPTKQPYFAVASNLPNAFKGAAFAGRKSTNTARNLALDKEGKLFVQVLYPDNEFTDGVSFTTLLHESILVGKRNYELRLS
jgi:hypothetical protein